MKNIIICLTLLLYSTIAKSQQKFSEAIESIWKNASLDFKNFKGKKIDSTEVGIFYASKKWPMGTSTVIDNKILKVQSLKFEIDLNKWDYKWVKEEIKNSVQIIKKLSAENNIKITEYGSNKNYSLVAKKNDTDLPTFSIVHTSNNTLVFLISNYILKK